MSEQDDSDFDDLAFDEYQPPVYDQTDTLDPPDPLNDPQDTTSPAKKRKTRPKRYACDFVGCDKCFDVPAKLRDHVRTHTGERPYSCTEEGCDKTFAKKTSLMAHMDVHDPTITDRFPCEYCDKSFPRKQAYKIHVRTQHEEAKHYPCTWDGCDATFTQEYLLRTHMTSHTNKRQYPCEHPGCNSSFRWPNRLRYHMETVHRDVEKYFCNEEGCDAKFLRFNELRSHMFEVHPATCHMCGKQFARPSLLSGHMKTVHSGLRLNCEYEDCDKVFKTKKSLKNHMDRTHMNIRPPRRHVCPTCGRGFPFASGLNKHLPVHDPNRPKPERNILNELSGKDYDDDDARKYNCPFTGCERKYKYEHLLRRHLRSIAHRDQVADYEAMTSSSIESPCDDEDGQVDENDLATPIVENEPHDNDPIPQDHT
ncbi:hypothetical protein BC940DRAFT_301074 [Gongronella butleri]|nr:hypothetical protein BC940DRAFT_301074 [Gongronella butleri]